MHSVDLQNGCETKYSSIKYSKLDYKIDFYEEFKKKWLIIGVIAAVFAAVLSPTTGSHGEYTSYIPLTYIYLTAGVKSTTPELKLVLTDARFHIATQTFAHVVTPALVAVLCWLLTVVDLDQRVLRGALISSCGGTNTWLCVGFLAGGASHACAVTTAVVDTLVTAVAVPVSLLVICGCAGVPPLSHLVSSLAALLPLGLGVVLRSRLHRLCVGGGAKCAALVVLYVRCCNELRDSEGAMDVGHVFGAIGLASLWVCCGGALCYGLATVVCPHRSRAAMLCANHKSFHNEWHRPLSCSARGAGRLVALISAPAQAALLAGYMYTD